MIPAPKPPAREPRPRRRLQAKRWGVSDKPQKPLKRTKLKLIGQGAKKRLARYQDRLKRSDWVILRRMVFERDGYRCVRCGHQNRKGIIGGLVCDHKTYRRFGHEDLDDLQTLCRDCDRRKDGWKAARAMAVRDA